MKATLDLNSKLYSAAERLARQKGVTVETVVDECLRRGLAAHQSVPDDDLAELERHNGFEVLKEREGPRVTVSDVARICREEGI